MVAVHRKRTAATTTDCGGQRDEYVTIPGLSFFSTNLRQAVTTVQTQDFSVIEQCRRWLQQGQRPWLCTIVRTIGSSPRPVGSLLAALDSGEQTGSLSGGCVEEDLLDKLRAGHYSGDRPQLLEYGVSAEENERLGLPCGGRLHIILQRLGADDAQWLEAVAAAIDQRRCIARTLNLESGETRLAAVEHFQSLEISEKQLRQCFGPRMRMLLVGAGQLAHSLAELALAMDYEVIVTDPRETFRAQWQLPGVELLGGMPDDVIRERANDNHSIIITLTHDPRIDDMALMEALTTEAWYIGALGSVRTTAKRLSRLQVLGLSDTQLARLHAPVGIEIGSKTPIEIAISILAELTQLRRREAKLKALGA